jgi:hypothetical protein
MAGSELQGICTYLMEVAKEAGSIILTARPTSLAIVTKKNSLYVSMSLFLHPAN